MGFYGDIIFWESRCNIEINVWAHFYKILSVFEVPYRPRVKGMPGKRLKLPKVGKTCLKICFFIWFTHWWNRFCESDWLGVSKDTKKYLNFIKMSSDFDFTVTSWFLGNICIKPHFNTQCPHPDFGRSVKPIQRRRKDYAHDITTLIYRIFRPSHGPEQRLKDKMQEMINLLSRGLTQLNLWPPHWLIELVKNLGMYPRGRPVRSRLHLYFQIP